MTTAIEQIKQIPGHWLIRHIGTLLGRDYHRRNCEAECRNYRNGQSTDLHRAIVYSRHTHYDPFQVAIEEELNAWAQHATASNGFSDLP